MYLFKLVDVCFVYIPKNGIAGSHGSSIFSFWEASILFSTVAAPICILTSSVWEFPFCHIFADICYLCSFKDSHSDSFLSYKNVFTHLHSCRIFSLDIEFIYAISFISVILLTLKANVPSEYSASGQTFNPKCSLWI